MSNKIFKYSLIITDKQTINLPRFADILKIDYRNGELFFWARVNPKHETYPVTFIIAGTGHVLPKMALNHIETVFNGPFVWHIFVEAD